MKVAIDTTPIDSGHSFRGIGSYTKNLVDELKKGDWGIDFEFFNNASSPPPADVIHYPYFDLFFHTLPIKKNSRRVVTIHDVIPLVFPERFPSGIKGYINLFFQKKALKNTDAIICDSQTSKKDIIEKLSVPEKKVHVVYLAPSKSFKKLANQKVLEKIRKKYKLPKEFALYVGDVNWNKNIINLLEAIKHSGTNLVMVGKALEDKNLIQTKQINKKIKALGLSDEVTKTGYTPEDDLVGIYNLATVTVSPSYYEGFGLPVLESMASGTPVICSNVASLSEITGDVATYCDPDDPTDISNKIKLITNLSSQERKSLSEKSQKHAIQYSWAKTAKETVAIYKSI